VRSGQGAVLVVRGEPGIGKTALLRHLIGQASGFHVVRAAGVESEMELVFAGLHQLCAPMLGPTDQRATDGAGASRGRMPAWPPKAV
jgi:hypothetical protein